MAGWGTQCLVPLLVCQTWALRGSKICIFLRYTHITQFFGATQDHPKHHLLGVKHPIWVYQLCPI